MNHLLLSFVIHVSVVLYEGSAAVLIRLVLAGKTLHGLFHSQISNSSRSRANTLQSKWYIHLESTHTLNGFFLLVSTHLVSTLFLDAPTVTGGFEGVLNEWIRLHTN